MAREGYRGRRSWPASRRRRRPRVGGAWTLLVIDGPPCSSTLSHSAARPPDRVPGDLGGHPTAGAKGSRTSSTTTRPRACRVDQRLSDKGILVGHRPEVRPTLVDADRRAGGRAELRLGSGVMEREPRGGRGVRGAARRVRVVLGRRPVDRARTAGTSLPCVEARRPRATSATSRAGLRLPSTWPLTTLTAGFRGEPRSR